MPDSSVLVPVRGAWVSRADTSGPGRVCDQRQNGTKVEVRVKWFDDAALEWVDPSNLRSGFRLCMDVQDIPHSRTRRPLGEGIVLEIRHIGGRDQVLVEFPALGQRIWLPYENLRQIKGVTHRFVLGQAGDAGNAERFRLKSLAYALEMWNQNTGSLSRLEIDPLPHQIHLVHRILASGNFNWLIADDVGLGKTIEVGMLISALQHRGNFRRILLITPAGLVRQWQEELHHKFGLSEFQIYGEEFRINDPRHWKLYDHVIGSIDRLKVSPHFELLMQAGTWDLIIFDEAHRLSRRQWGRRLEAADRFKLATALRRNTDAMLLLTGTPHQGMQDKFQALLELLRPELKNAIRSLSLNPGMLRDMVIRNHKADVTDANGEFIFRGKTTRAIEVPLGDEEREFDRSLQRYLREGYGAADARTGTLGRAIGFTMTTYRKLAASSSAAIERALVGRLARVKESVTTDGGDPEEIEQRDNRFSGEWEEKVQTSGSEFFDGEIALLEDLITRSRVLMRNDRKLSALIDDFLPGILQANKDEKVLIFTEYRATQDYLTGALERQFGESAVALINGSQSYIERETAVGEFEESAQFLISTEAGGEGLNLHRRCRIMVNFDLPWNPMRLVQRVGRLYRYGQKHPVLVLNMHAPQTIDAQIMGLLYARIGQVVNDLAPVGVEFRSGLEDEILGELADVLDVEEILADATRTGIQRTRERVEAALHRAKEAIEKQRELFEYTSGYDPNEAKGELRVGDKHLRAFVVGMLDPLGIDIVKTMDGGRVLDLRLPEHVLDELPGQHPRLRVAFDRDFASRRRELEMMDFQSRFFQYLVQKAKSYEFDGIAARVGGVGGRGIITAILRWQNDQGTRMREEYTALQVDGEGVTSVNPETFSEWLLSPTEDGEYVGNKEEGKQLLGVVERAMDERLAEVTNLELHPENRQWVNAAWCS